MTRKYSNYGLSADSGLNVLKDRWGQKRFIAEHCQYLTDNLQIAIDATHAAAHERTRGFNLDRRGKPDARNRERYWEHAVWQRWKSPGNAVEGCWDFIPAYQVPLFDREQRDRWGHIDLLGLGDGSVAIIELKKEPSTSRGGESADSTDTPLRMLMEAAAYAIAVRKNWAELRRQLAEHLRKTLGDDHEAALVHLPTTPGAIRLVCLAPVAFWKEWTPFSPRGRQVEPQTWTAFRGLLRAFEAKGYPTSFACLLGKPENPEKLRVWRLTRFPMT